MRLREIVDRAWGLLSERNDQRENPRFYKLGDALVELEPGPAVPRTFNIGGLRLTLDRLADWTRVTAKGEERVAVPPKDALDGMLATPPASSLPILEGVVSAPYLAPCGRVVTAEGYDPTTGLHLALRGLRVPPVPDRPTGAELDEARRLLLDDLLSDFRFATDADAANAVAGLLLPVVRPSIGGPTPLHMIEAPIEGSGKGLLAAVIGQIAVGGPPTAIMTEGRDEDEWRKRVTAALIRTPPIVLLDNVKGRLDSAALSAALTAENGWTDRLLGATRMVTLPINCIWLATANNPAYSGEMARRVVRIRIDAGVEKPWERTDWKHPKLLAWAGENRGRLLWALLVFARHWVSAGRPAGREVMGSFDGWVQVVGGILAEAGIDGLLGNREEVYQQAASESEAWRALIDLWWAAYGAQRVGVEHLHDLAVKHKLLTDLRAGRTDRGARTALGIELARLRDRVVGPYRVRAAGDSGASGAALYRLERTDTRSTPERKSTPEKVTEVTEVTDEAKPAISEPKEPSEPFPDLRAPETSLQECRECGAGIHYYSINGAPWCERHGPGSGSGWGTVDEDEQTSNQ